MFVPPPADDSLQASQSQGIVSKSKGCKRTLCCPSFHRELRYHSSTGDANSRAAARYENHELRMRTALSTLGQKFSREGSALDKCAAPP